jgi:hypothetical protein
MNFFHVCLEDCLEKVPTALNGYCYRRNGAPADPGSRAAGWDSNREIVTALPEIASGKVRPRETSVAEITDR